MAIWNSVKSEIPVKLHGAHRWTMNGGCPHIGGREKKGK